MQHTARLDGRRCSLHCLQVRARAVPRLAGRHVQHVGDSARAVALVRRKRGLVHVRNQTNNQTNKPTNRLCLRLDALSRRCAALPDAPLPPSPVNSCCTHTAAHTFTVRSSDCAPRSGRAEQSRAEQSSGSHCALYIAQRLRSAAEFHRSRTPAGAVVSALRARAVRTVCKSSARILTSAALEYRSESHYEHPLPKRRS